jgi:hypothetical protein
VSQEFAPSLVQGDLGKIQSDIALFDQRLRIVETSSQNLDAESFLAKAAMEDADGALGGEGQLVKQTWLRLGNLEATFSAQQEEVTRIGGLVQKEVDVMHNLLQMTGKSFEEMQHRVLSMEQNYPPGELQKLQAAIHSALSEVRGKVDNQAGQIEQVRRDLERSGEVQEESMRQVSEGIKEYITRLIDNIDSKPNMMPVPQVQSLPSTTQVGQVVAVPDDLTSSARSAAASIAMSVSSSATSRPASVLMPKASRTNAVTPQVSVADGIRPSPGAVSLPRTVSTGLRASSPTMGRDSKGSGLFPQPGMASRIVPQVTPPKPSMSAVALKPSATAVFPAKAAPAQTPGR